MTDCRRDLDEALSAYAAQDHYPFHMPGHKRRTDLAGEAAGKDITEIAGFDDLHCAEGILLEAQQRAADLYGSKRAFYLVNGSTAGILAAVSAALPRGGTLLAARNSHRSLYHAAALRGLRVHWLYPEQRKDEAGAAGISGPVSAREVERMLSLHPETGAVFLTSPTYDGVVSDVEAAAEAAHRAGALLIVDAAHGAHFGMHPAFPENAVRQGADLVVHSLHKTLPSLTQTALLHLCSERVSAEDIALWLRIYMTSSPSYVLMAGMDSCIGLMKSRGEELLGAFAGRLLAFRREAASWKTFRLLPADDPSKLLIGTGTSGTGGRQLAAILREKYRLEPEMEAPGYVLMLTSLADTDEGFARLAAAMRELDAAFPSGEGADAARPALPALARAETAMTIAQAMEGKKKAVPLADAAGLISAEFLYLYPPGVPLIAPGEVITRELADLADALLREGYALQGAKDRSAKTLLTTAE